jgi:hypothetical protein
VLIWASVVVMNEIYKLNCLTCQSLYELIRRLVSKIEDDMGSVRVTR